MVFDVESIVSFIKEIIFLLQKFKFELTLKSSMILDGNYAE